jgi:uncharacterized protein YutE (UPF0331/DUF86 family)
MNERIPLNIQKIRNIIADIEGNLEELKSLASLSLEEFRSDRKNYGLAEHYLRRSLEGILTIGSHILSRLPAKTKDYQQIIISLGEYGIIPKDFAEKNKRLASYRNRLVHLYWEVSLNELYTVIQQHLEDLTLFCRYFRDVLKTPERFGLRR